VGAWSPSLDGDLEPVTGVERVGLICARGTDEACVFRGTQLGTLIRESPSLRRYGLTMAWHRSDNWNNKVGGRKERKRNEYDCLSLA
jgi:hypothetical protein